MSRANVAAVVFLGVALSTVGCSGESADGRSGFRVEGTEAGDCEDNADNDADGLFDCDDPGCAGSSLCAAEIDGGTDGIGGNAGTGGEGAMGGSGMAGMGGMAGEGGTAGSAGAGGSVGAGGVGGGVLCAGVDCEDGNECTEDTCNPVDGECGYTNVTAGMTCDFGGFPGVCGAGVCEDAMLCAGVDCDDGNECTQDVCDPMDGQCGYADVMDGTTCDFGGLPGVCTAGTCTTGPCVTNALCHTCPDQFLCDTDDDCPFSGYVCVASGCETGQGAAIKQCQPSRGGSCTNVADCPNSTDYECIPVGAGSPRCVRVTPGCSPATETYDCPPGFSCEGGACVDRRMPCDSHLDCPKSHVCTATPSSRYCIRTHRTCNEDTDCGGFAAVGSFCADVDNDGTKECVGELGASGQGCVNADCGGSAPVCEVGAAPTAASCGDYGLCRNTGECDAGFECVGLWQDGRRECVLTGGTCDQVADCPLQQVCAAPRGGGPPSCQAGSLP